MQVSKKQLNDTHVLLTIGAQQDYLEPIKQHTLKHLRGTVNVPGFREGKAPVELLEKHIDQNTLQKEFLEEAINHLYADAVRREQLRPAANPSITLKKFVPFGEVEFEAEVEIIGEVKLTDYKKIKRVRQTVKVTVKDVNDVIEALKKRMAEKKPVARAAQKGDEAWIDFKGTDEKGAAVKGADGKDYPLILGSDTFIPGFETNIEGMKAGDKKAFTLTFPKDYRIKALAGKKVTFDVTVTKLHELVEPELNDAFAQKVGPVKTVEELKADIKRQLEHEKRHEADRQLEDGLVKEIAQKSTVAIPESLITQQIERMLGELRQNLTYRGQTYQEFLEAEHTTDDAYRAEILRPQAEERIKAGLVLAEIAEAEQLSITPEELEVRIQILKGQYKDSSVQAELNKPEARRDIASRLLTEKTVAKLVGYATN